MGKKNKNKMYYAHSLPGEPREKWQSLEDHLKNVAELAKRFAEPFGAGDMAYAAGLLHDIGKYSNAFQEMLAETNSDETSSEIHRGPDHSSAGAQEINKRFTDGLGKLLAYLIAGHHAGLLDGQANGACLHRRLENLNIPDYSVCPRTIYESIPKVQLPAQLTKRDSPEVLAFRLQFFVRMLFSCLVDADFLDTEAFMNKKNSSLRGRYDSLTELYDKVQKELNSIIKNSPDSLVNRKRREVLEQCLYKAKETPGLFSLTVPTGGGKTLSSLSFALEHAKKYGMQRVIYVIPYTSIIEQNADVFKRICGDDAVLEHHSNFEFTEDSYKAQLAAENWDAPLIVTTNVQFFETLFHYRTSKCRKAHNIANSVIIFDEAQMLPVDLLRPCMAAIEELALNYKVTAVLCSATQPALGKSDEFRYGIEGIREIINRPDDLYQSLRRVMVSRLPVISNVELAERISGNRNRQVLCVVNTRKHARQIFDAIQDKTGLFHLSGLMCPVHRTEVLDRIRLALKEVEPCRVVSTQLIEAGVDVDFPVVFRALAGIDSIAQSAGRCNREGKLGNDGKVYVFMPENANPPGYLRQSAEEAEGIIRNFDDILSLKAVHEYFKNLYWRHGNQLDRHQIISRFAEGVRSCNFPFKTAGEDFRMIENGTQSIVIPYNDEAKRLIHALKASDSRGVARKLQRYTVQVFPDVIKKLGLVALEAVHEHYYILINDHLYKPDIGLDWNDPYFRNIEGNIC
ncbi:MAG: CRISPR-associated helicase Cas3' [Candidatus Omnitrophica bacterium]|nr:CRISPR-associated helicase Cas3' [Candidatus Omnitrophota bacterium]